MGDTLYVSGEIGFDLHTGQIPKESLPRQHWHRSKTGWDGSLERGPGAGLPHRYNPVQTDERGLRTAAGLEVLTAAAHAWATFRSALPHPMCPRLLRLGPVARDLLPFAALLDESVRGNDGVVATFTLDH